MLHTYAINPALGTPDGRHACRCLRSQITQLGSASHLPQKLGFQHNLVPKNKTKQTDQTAYLAESSADQPQYYHTLVF